ncbi:DUF6011 domain-containing protein [Nonomuraea thailandensis]
MADEPALIVGLDDESVVGQAPTTGRCRCCRHKLLDPVSLAYGMGPDCRKRLGTTPRKPVRLNGPLWRTLRWTGQSPGGSHDYRVRDGSGRQVPLRPGLHRAYVRPGRR